jgi:periplasmic protein TonB
MTQLDDRPTHDPPYTLGGRPYRVPIGLPARDEGRRAGAIVSVLVHLLVIALLIAPFMMPGAVIERMQQGAGGAGPAGGGGGGSGGTGGTKETLRFLPFSPPPRRCPRRPPCLSHRSLSFRKWYRQSPHPW